MTNKSAVSIGIEFENRVLNLLIESGLEAWRTNKANPDDPEQYKAGFDGGVDIIARCQEPRDYIFYIQCKCHKTELAKTAISEVYAGMHARSGVDGVSIPVVFSTSGASEETRQYAKSLGVELILSDDMNRLNHAKIYGETVYANYGTLMRVLIYHYTKDKDLVNCLPDYYNELSNQNIKSLMLEEAKVSLNDIQSKWDVITSKEFKLQQERQRALDATKYAIIQNIHSVDYYRKDNGNKKNVKREVREKPTITKDSG